MQPSKWLEKQVSFTYAQLARFFFISLITIISIFVVVIWVLSTSGIISQVWASVFSVIFILFGILLAFLQWYAPRAPASAQTSAELHNPMPSLSAEDEAYRVFIDGIRQRFYDSPNPHSTGMLVIRADKSLVSQFVSVEQRTCYISERTEKGKILYIGIIKDIPKGNYSAITSQLPPRQITIYTREVTEVDLRNNQH